MLTSLFLLIHLALGLRHQLIKLGLNLSRVSSNTGHLAHLVFHQSTQTVTAASMRALWILNDINHLSILQYSAGNRLDPVIHVDAVPFKV